MVPGLDSFKEAFKDFQGQYVLIGGAACDVWYTRQKIGDFRATRDLDIVLIIEAITPEFQRRFWQYVKEGQYEFFNRNKQKPTFYRFKNPKAPGYPRLLEIFTRRPNGILLPDDAALTPLPIDEEQSSLSAILLNDDYYRFLTMGTNSDNDITILQIPHLIVFKMKAWLDLNARKAAGEHVDRKDIKKHKNDVFSLSQILDETEKITVPAVIMQDIEAFIQAMKTENVSLEALNIMLPKEIILQRFLQVFQKEE